MTVQQKADLLVFEECVGKSKSECLILIKDALTNNPILMSVTSFDNYTIDALRARNEMDPNFNYVALRTNYNETHVVDILGDGIVLSHRLEDA